MDDTKLLLKLLDAERLHQQKSNDDNWYAGNLRFLLHDAQEIIYDDYYKSNDKVTTILASRRFGKSFLSVIWCLEYAIRNPRTIVRFVPPEIKQAWAIVQPTFMKLEQMWPRGLVRYRASEKAWEIGQGSWMYLGGFDSQFDSARGGEASLIVCDEAGFSNPENYLYILRSVLMPQLLTTRGRMVIPSTPSVIPDHPFMTETVAAAKLKGKLHKYTIYDNPMLDAGQIEEAKRDAGGEASISWQVEYLCESVRSPRLMVVPGWKDEHIVTNYEPKPYHYRAVVGDFGGVQDKTVIYALSYDYRSPLDGDFVILDEREYEPNTTTSEIVKGINELALWLKTDTQDQNDIIYLDCPGQLQVDLNQYHGLSVAVPFKDNFHAGIGLLNTMVDTGRLKVHERCKFAAFSLNNARFNDRKTDYIRTESLGHCDGIAAAIYGIRMLQRLQDGKPQPVVNKDNQAYWKQNPVKDRVKLADAIFGRR